MLEFTKSGEFFKADGRLIYGWALVSETKDAQGTWKRYVDSKGDHVPEDVAVEAAIHFAKNSRVGKDMHAGEQVAHVPLVYVVTRNSGALGIETSKTGILIGWEPTDPALLDAVANGSRTGFSIGGHIEAAGHGDIGKFAKEATARGTAERPRIFRRFFISEISLVDSPAMKGALVGYVKNAEPEETDGLEAITKAEAAFQKAEADLFGYVEKRAAEWKVSTGRARIRLGQGDGGAEYDQLYIEHEAARNRRLYGGPL